MGMATILQILSITHLAFSLVDGREVQAKCVKETINKVFDKDTSTDKCSLHEISHFPPADYISYVFYPKGMDNFILTERELSGSTTVRFYFATKDEGKTLLIYFPGTSNVADIKIDLTVKHHKVDLPHLVDPQLTPEQLDKYGGNTFRIHDGVHRKLFDNKVQNSLQTNLLYKIKKKQIKKLIIGGHSLGGAYATYLFLRLYGDDLTRKAPGLDLLPDKIEDVTVIPIAAPSIIYFKDIRKINSQFLKRITNIWNYADPVPIILNGMQPVTKENLALSFTTMIKYGGDYPKISLGTNQPIGNIILIIQGKKRIQLTDKEMKEKNGKKKRFFGLGKHFVDSNNWKYSQDKEVWIKFIPWQHVNPYSKNAEYYAKFGATCLWKRTEGGALGALHYAIKYHPMKKYRESLLKSCLRNYLNENSKYFQGYVLRKLAREKEETSGAKLKKLLFRANNDQYDDKYDEQSEFVDDYYDENV
eukprot:1355_1